MMTPVSVNNVIAMIALWSFRAINDYKIDRHTLFPACPVSVKRAGLKPGQVKISDAALKTIINGYAREAGVRGLEKSLGKEVTKINLGVKDLADYLQEGVEVHYAADYRDVFEHIFS